MIPLVAPGDQPHCSLRGFTQFSFFSEFSARRPEGGARVHFPRRPEEGGSCIGVPKFGLWRAMVVHALAFILKMAYYF